MTATTVATPAAENGSGKPSANEHLENELAFYASYHSNPINVGIHFVFIPQIWWSWLIIAGHLRLPGTTFVDLAPGLSYQPSLGMLFAIVFQLYYFFLSDFVGITYLPVMLAEYLTSAYLVAHPPSWLPFLHAFGPAPSALAFGLFVFFNGWFWQFVGHFAFEGRAPAVFDNLTQALVTAPFFVHIETLFGLFHWNPQLHKRITNLASKRIVAMNRANREKAKKAQ